MTKYDQIMQQPGDLFFKWLGWLRLEDRQQREWEAALRGAKLHSNNIPAEPTLLGFAKMQEHGGAKIITQRIKKPRKL